MKKIILLALSALLFYGCEPFSDQPLEFTEYTPILISRNSLNQSVSLQPSTPILEAAKIYYKENYIFISERFKGVHIIDNTNPKAPINKSFIAVPGCLDIAIKQDILYVDNAIDLVAINLSAIESGNLNIVKRIENVFPEVAPPDGGMIPSKFNELNRPANTIIIGWKLK